MLGPLSNTIHDVMDFVFPMIIISIVILSSLRITYLIKNKEPFILHKELFMLFFIVYILSLFQIVTAGDINSFGSNNFIPFQEITRYSIGSNLFIKNILGNVLLFVPFGFFLGLYLKLEKTKSATILVLIASFSIEVTQLMIGRVFDVDDIILNLVGGIIGFTIYRLLDQIGEHLPKILKSNWFLNIISVILLIGFILFI